MQPLHVPAGATIFRTGDPSPGVFIIKDGEVAITVGDAIEVVRLHPGELFGESGVPEARPRSATATAMVATTLLVTPAETFLHAFGMDNDRALALVKLLCRRLRNTTHRAIGQGDASTAPTAIRLLPDCERLATEYGMQALDVRQLPFQVGNRYGGETLPVGSNHTCCIPARGDPDLGCTAFRDPAPRRPSWRPRPGRYERDDRQWNRYHPYLAERPRPAADRGQRDHRRPA
jgi:hypothetical protein